MISIYLYYFFKYYGYENTAASRLNGDGDSSSGRYNKMHKRKLETSNSILLLNLYLGNKKNNLVGLPIVMTEEAGVKVVALTFHGATSNISMA